MRPYNKMIFVTVVLLVAISAVNVGCGGGSRAGTVGSAGGPNPAPTPTPTPAPNPVPQITVISPKNVLVRGAFFSLTVNGSNFLTSSVVRLNGSSRGTTFVSSSQLTTQISASDIDKPGQAAITVLNPPPGGGMSNSLALTILPAIAFESSRALDGSDAANVNETENIWVVDGSGATPLTKLTAGIDVGSFTPVWSPDHGKIAFVSGRALDGSNAANANSTENIWIMNADGSGTVPLTKITAADANSFDQAWSPEGGKIVFTSIRALDGSDAKNANSIDNLWLMNSDGSGALPLTKLTAMNAGSDSAVWSPDGSKIAFVGGRRLDGSDGPGNRNLWVMNADGTGVRPLTMYTAANARVGGSVVWSPNGNKIAFESSGALNGSDAANTNFSFNAWTINADGSGMTPLTKLTAASTGAFFPAWSPDGNKIAFESNRALDGSNTANTNSDANVWVINADGSGPTPLTRYTAASVRAGSPKWSPDGGKLTFESSAALDGSNAANTNGNYNIWIINGDGSAITPLTKLTAPNVISEHPQW